MKTENSPSIVQHSGHWWVPQERKYGSNSLTGMSLRNKEFIPRYFTLFYVILNEIVFCFLSLVVYYQ